MTASRRRRRSGENPAAVAAASVALAGGGGAMTGPAARSAETMSAQENVAAARKRAGRGSFISEDDDGRAEERGTSESLVERWGAGWRRRAHMMFETTGYRHGRGSVGRAVLALARAGSARVLAGMKIRGALFMTMLGVWLAGCASYTAHVEPGTQFSTYRRFWVKSNLDDNHALDRLLVQTLKARGFEAEHGPLTMMPREAQAIVSYRDRWAWDFKNHMTGLEITVQDARSEQQVAAANFVGPASLTLTPLEVVERLVRDLEKATPKVIEMPL
jgi:hypothetical protein